MANCFGEDCWQKAFCYIENLFGIEALFLEQKEAIKAFIKKYTNAYVSLPTGDGKSLIFQSLLSYTTTYMVILEAQAC